ncbi:hypothetical protein SAMN04489796_1011375 [Winogradskyella thalassocola]|uniref:Toprim-like n=2 Tax=Winogradskyella thalassocola TaxID=262004 RepID=A0A1G7ZM81_9FLAO|nr:hypothetical protein SAMN04489796_1011375 [Winogradskyella thalassocola]
MVRVQFKMTYKYTLDRTSKKFSCPSCGKKTLVCYIEVETSRYLESTLGRCDRESKCAYHKSPSGNIPITSSVLQKIEEPSCHDDTVIGSYGRNYSNNNFVQYLRQYFCTTDIEGVIREYFIGTTTYWKGATIFWQVDHQMNVCAGKVMLYNGKNGKRVKKPRVFINWMHKVLQIDDFVLQQCLFGIHNLCDYKKGDTICIVESEKTAIIMSLFYPSYLWLATGSKTNLKLSVLKPLKDYKIIVYPDKSEYKSWNIKVEAFQKMGYTIICSDFLEDFKACEGADLADVMI